jgi:hypothetical protein
MASVVYCGSPRQACWDAKETVPAQLDLMEAFARPLLGYIAAEQIGYRR